MEIAAMNANPPLVPRPDGIARALVFAGALVHGIGANILKARNEDLAAQLERAHAELGTLVNRAYLLGRHHNDTGQPSPAAEDLAGIVRTLHDAPGAGADEHQGDEPVTTCRRDASTASTYDASPSSTATGAPVAAAGHDASPSTGATPAVDEHQGADHGW
jgi:hypothetical protein